MTVRDTSPMCDWCREPVSIVGDIAMVNGRPHGLGDCVDALRAALAARDAEVAEAIEAMPSCRLQEMAGLPLLAHVQKEWDIQQHCRSEMARLATERDAALAEVGRLLVHVAGLGHVCGDHVKPYAAMLCAKGHPPADTVADADALAVVEYHREQVREVVQLRAARDAWRELALAQMELAQASSDLRLARKGGAKETGELARQQQGAAARLARAYVVIGETMETDTKAVAPRVRR